MNPRVLVLLLSLLACPALAAPASAGGVTGNWTGETSQGLKAVRATGR
jgi:hypothetical protein